MDSGFYAACTGLLAETDALELTANNLANLSTTGYKGQLEFRRALEASQGKHRLSPINQAVNNYGILGGAALDLKVGEFQKTGNSLDLAIKGSSFFAVNTSAGVRYTRDGSFHTDSTGRLLTEMGDPVMGTQGPIELPSGTVSISADGTISQKGAVVAQLKMVDFKPGSLIKAEGNSYYQAPAGADQAATDPRLSQGMLEGSNMDSMSGAVSLITLQRHAQLLEQALSIFHSVFNNAPAQDLSRVS